MARPGGFEAWFGWKTGVPGSEKTDKTGKGGASGRGGDDVPSRMDSVSRSVRTVEKREAATIDPKVELEDAEWFHGLLPRSEIVSLLEEEASWLVRSTEKESGLFIVVSAKWKGQVKHIMLKRTDRGWVMPERCFATVPELVSYFHRTGESINEAGVNLLGKAVPRRSWMVPSKDVITEKKIGEGNFGEVFLGKLRVKNNWIPVALKTCKALVGRNEKEEFMKEAKLMLLYQHPNVVRIYAVAADKPPLMLVMEMCSGGALNKFLTSHAPMTKMETKVRFCMEGARGMEYLAVKKNCIHRDLAARNVLLGARNDVKIADFGLTRQGTYQMSASSANRQIPVRWTAPEALTSGCFSKETDVYSFGVLMWEILADAKQPWTGKTAVEAFKAAKSGEKMPTPPWTPPELESLMHRTWDLNPKLRPDMTNIRHALEGIHNKLTAA